MTRVFRFSLNTSGILLTLIARRVYDLEGQIKTWGRRGGKVPRERKDKLIAQARAELSALARVRTELHEVPAVPVAASSAAGNEAAGESPRSVTATPAVTVEQAKALLGVDDYELWRRRQQANIAFREGEVWED